MTTARIYLAAIAEDMYLDHGEEYRNVSYIIDAMIYMFPYAFRDHFLSIPNVQDADYFDLLMHGYTEDSDDSALDAALRNKPSYEWCRVVYDKCLSCLDQCYGRWEVVSYRILGDVVALISSGDYRVHVYNRMFGIGRVSVHDHTPLDKKDVTDPFFVSDNVTPEIDEDVYETGWDDGIKPLAVTTYDKTMERATCDDNKAERIHVVSEDEILDSFVMHEEFVNTRIDEETEKEIKRLKSSNKNEFDVNKLDKKILEEMDDVGKEHPEIRSARARYDVVCARRRRKSGRNAELLRRTWSFSTENKRIRDREKLRLQLD